MVLPKNSPSASTITTAAASTTTKTTTIPTETPSLLITEVQSTNVKRRSKWYSICLINKSRLIIFFVICASIFVYELLLSDVGNKNPWKSITNINNKKNHTTTNINSNNDVSFNLSKTAIQFPDNFVWGVATSSYQIEGGRNERGETIWDVFSEHSGHNIQDGSNASIADDHYHLWKQDVALMSTFYIFGQDEENRRLYHSYCIFRLNYLVNRKFCKFFDYFYGTTTQQHSDDFRKS
jgi:hypothetical protein